MDFVVASDYFTNAITLWRMYLSISSVMSNSFRPHGLQHARPPYPHQLLECTQTHVHWFGDAVQPSHPLSSPSPPALNLSQPSGSFQMSQLFASGGQSITVLALTSVLPMNTQDWSPCSPGDSQESSPTPQFKSINSSVLSFLYSPTLTSIRDYWKNHSLD